MTTEVANFSVGAYFSQNGVESAYVQGNDAATLGTLYLQTLFGSITVTELIVQNAQTHLSMLCNIQGVGYWVPVGTNNNLAAQMNIEFTIIGNGQATVQIKIVSYDVATSLPESVIYFENVLTFTSGLLQLGSTVARISAK